MVKKSSFLPKNLTEWLTAVCLISGIVASVYSSTIKPYHFVRDINERLVKVEAKLEAVDRSINRLEKKIWKYE